MEACLRTTIFRPVFGEIWVKPVTSSTMSMVEAELGEAPAKTVPSDGMQSGSVANGAPKPPKSTAVAQNGAARHSNASENKDSFCRPQKSLQTEPPNVLNGKGGSERSFVCLQASHLNGSACGEGPPLVNGVHANGFASDCLLLEDTATPFTSHEEGGSRDAAASINGCNGSSQEWVEEVVQHLDDKVDTATLTEEALELLRLIPPGYIPLPHQVGGHRHVDGKLGFLRRVGQTETLFKPVQVGLKGHQEVSFYQKLFSRDLSSLPDDVQTLHKRIPHYYGVETIQDRAGHLHEFLKLEDIVHKFSKPCIIDIKMGRRVWDDFAERDKIERERKKYPEQDVLGFRIIGMRVYKSAEDRYMYFDKNFGRSVKVPEMLGALNQYFMDGPRKRYDVLDRLLAEVEDFKLWVESQTTFKLFATSLLVVYEGDATRPITTERDLLDIRLVDFAHAYERTPGDVRQDENLLYGLRSLVRTLKELQTAA